MIGAAFLNAVTATSPVGVVLVAFDDILPNDEPFDTVGFVKRQTIAELIVRRQVEERDEFFNLALPTKEI